MSKKKSPVVLTQETIKSVSKLYWLSKSVVLLPPKKLRKKGNSNILDNDDTDDYNTTLDKTNAASIKEENKPKAKSTQSYILPWYFSNKFLT